MVDFNLFIKYFAGKADPEEALLVEDWAIASEEQQAFFHDLHQSWLIAGDELYAMPDIQREWETFAARHDINRVKVFEPAKKQWLPRVAAVVAIFVTAIAGFYLFNTKNQNEPTTIAEATDQAIQLRLGDGTRVTVQPDGELVYPVTFKHDTREVTLVGNGSFDVVHNPAQPFIVHLGDLHVKVLGTAFDIERNKTWISVKVNRGKVAFYNKKDTIIIAEGAIGKYIKSDKKLVLEQPIPLTGSFHFNNTPLKDVFAALATHFKVKINLTNTEINNCLLSAGFEAQSLKDILTAISATFNLHTNIESQNIEISGNGCK